MIEGGPSDTGRLKQFGTIWLAKHKRSATPLSQQQRHTSKQPKARLKRSHQITLLPQSTKSQGLKLIER